MSPVAAGEMILRAADDLEIVPAPALAGVEVAEDDVLVGRRRSRQPPALLSADAMALLDVFRRPHTVADAVLALSRRDGSNPWILLAECFSTVVRLTVLGLLVTDDREGSSVPYPRQPGDIAGHAVCRQLIRSVTDTEVWRGELVDHPPKQVAIKIIDAPGVGPAVFRAEQQALRVLNGEGAPRLLQAVPSETGGILISEWIDGDPVDLVVSATVDRVRLAGVVLDRYAALHRKGVLHGDPHPGNVLVRPDGSIVLLDFGLARMDGGPPSPRPAGGESLDPRNAARMRAGLPIDDLTPVEETYAVAVLAYRILCGAAYLDLGTERSEALRRIVEDPPRPFAAAGGPRWAAGERVLRKALAKDAAKRYPDITRLAESFHRARRFPVLEPVSATALAEEVAAVATEFDVDGRWWPGGTVAADISPQDAAVAAAFLRRAATLVEDPTCADLAAVWSARAGAVAAPEPATHSAAHAVGRALARYRRSGRARDLAAARRHADAVAALPDPGPPSLTAGPLATLLARLECADPWQAACSPGGTTRR